MFFMVGSSLLMLLFVLSRLFPVRSGKGISRGCELPDRGPAALVSCYLRKVTPEVATPPASEVMVTKFGGGMLLKRIENTP